MAEIDLERLNQVELQFGGLRFEVYYTRYFGPTTRVFGQQNGEWTEMLRFDDFVDVPHYHAPAESDVAIMLDVPTQGEPIEFYMDVLSSKLPEHLPGLGFGDVLPTIDNDVVRMNLPTLRAAMSSVLPEGFNRAKGECLHDSDADRGVTRAEMFAKAQAAMAAAHSADA
jgi:hypothetical protein